MAALNKENCEKHPRSNLAQNSNVPRSQEDYITRVSEEIQGRATKKLSQEFSRTENRILCALARLDDFLMNPLIQGHSGTAPQMSRKEFSVNQGTNEDDSQSEPHPEAGLFHNHMTRNSDPEDGHDMVTGVQKERPYGHDMVTGVHEEVTNCSPSTSSGKQKRTTSQPQFRSENTLRRLKQSKSFWPFSSWQITTILQIFLTIITQFPNCQSRSRQRCPRSTGKQRSSSCLKISSRRASKLIIS